MSSQITPNNINQNYPVAGVDNNSQGFRDNFTSIKNNFIVTKREIDDIMNKVVVKEALTYGPAIDNNLNGVSLSNINLTGSGFSTVNLGTSNGAITLDFATGNYQKLTLNDSATLSFDNFSTGNAYGELYLSATVANISHTLGFSGSTLKNTEIIPGFNHSANTITFNRTGTYDFVFGSADEGANITIREISPRVNGAYVSSNTVITSSSLVTTGMGFNTLANVSYGFDAVIPFAHSNSSVNSHTFSVRFGTTGTGNGYYTVEQQAGPASTFTANTATTSNSTVSTVVTSSTDVKMARITGVYSHTANSSVTITAATSGGNLTILPGAHVKVTPLI